MKNKNEVKTAKTIKEYKTNFKGWAITVPAGSTVTNSTACGTDDSYRFWTGYGSYIEELTDCKNSTLAHDLEYHGLNIPAEYCEPYKADKGTTYNASELITDGENLVCKCGSVLTEENTKQGVFSFERVCTTCEAAIRDLDLKQTVSATVPAADCTGEHTPGPWRAELDTACPDGLCIKVGQDIVLAEVWGLEKPFPDADKEAKANARLIAAAPELLETVKALSLLVSHYATMPHANPSAHKTAAGANALIKKIEK